MHFHNLDLHAKLTIISGIILIGIFIYNLTSNHQKIQTMKNILYWIIIIFILIVIYSFRSEMGFFWERIIANIAPSHVSSYDGDRKISVGRSLDGHFHLKAKINDKSIEFLVDTGASDIAISKADAIRLGINISNLKYTKSYSTANGIVLAAPITLPKLQIGPIIFYDVKAHVNEGKLDTSLLGMSIINKFKSFSIDNDILILEY